jgi:outer membrane protein
MKKPAIAIILAALGMGFTAGAAMAEEGPWLVRARAVHIDPANKSTAIPGLGVAADAITISSKTIPEVDISYFFTPNIAAELILTYPQKHDVFLNGNNIGTFKHLPPTLLAQYHFTPASQLSPYVGAGINYTLFSKNAITVPGVGALGLEHKSVGFAIQAGVDYKLDKNWSLNLDIKKVQLRTDVNLAATGAKQSELKVDPVLVGVGVGYRF